MRETKGGSMIGAKSRCAKPVNNVSKAWNLGQKQADSKFKTAQNKALYSASHFNEGTEHLSPVHGAM